MLSEIASGAVNSKVYDTAVVDEMTGLIRVKALVVNTGVTVARTEIDPVTVLRSLREEELANGVLDVVLGSEADPEGFSSTESPIAEDPQARTNIIT